MKKDTAMPLISVITVCYNSVKTLEDTILSVLNQTYPHIEYIIIDGGSIDGTIDIIKKYEDKIAYWVSEPDEGIYDAMNKGIMRSTGDVIGILNSDDWYHKNTVSNAVFSFLENKCDIVHGDIVFTEIDGTLVRRLPPDKNSKNIWRGMIYWHPTWFVKKVIYEKFGMFLTNYLIAGDYELFLRFYKKKINFCYSNNIVVYMRLGGISDTKKTLGFKEVCDISINYDYSFIKAYYWRFYKTLRLRVSLRSLGLNFLASYKDKLLKYNNSGSKKLGVMDNEFPNPMNMLDSLRKEDIIFEKTIKD